MKAKRYVSCLIVAAIALSGCGKQEVVSNRLTADELNREIRNYINIGYNGQAYVGEHINSEQKEELEYRYNELVKNDLETYDITDTMNNLYFTLSEEAKYQASLTVYKDSIDHSDLGEKDSEDVQSDIDAYMRYKELGIEDIIEQIDSMEDKDEEYRIRNSWNIWQQYNNLPEEYKSSVTNIDKLRLFIENYGGSLAEGYNIDQALADYHAIQDYSGGFDADEEGAETNSSVEDILENDGETAELEETTAELEETTVGETTVGVSANDIPVVQAPPIDSTQESEAETTESQSYTDETIGETESEEDLLSGLSYVYPQEYIDTISVADNDFVVDEEKFKGLMVKDIKEISYSNGKFTFNSDGITDYTVSYSICDYTVTMTLPKKIKEIKGNDDYEYSIVEYTYYDNNTFELKAESTKSNVYLRGTYTNDVIIFEDTIVDSILGTLSYFDSYYVNNSQLD